MQTKQQILEEIRRTAKENDGKPLGTATFEKETGIGPFEWGRYWARFGDAVQEAGFKRNEPWRRKPDEFLIEKMIVKIRKFGRYPVLNELRIEGDSDPDFPYHAIKKRGQEFVVRKIVEYCGNKGGYDDILTACKSIIERFDKKEKFDDTRNNDRIGEVYLFKSGRYYKIGKTFDTVRRGKEIRIQLPEKLNLIHSIKTDDPSGVEVYWDKRFESKRMEGEWFNLDPSDIRAFKRWRKIY